MKNLEIDITVELDKNIRTKISLLNYMIRKLQTDRECENRQEKIEHIADCQDMIREGITPQYEDWVSEKLELYKYTDEHIYLIIDNVKAYTEITFKKPAVE